MFISRVERLPPEEAFARKMLQIRSAVDQMGKDRMRVANGTADHIIDSLRKLYSRSGNACGEPIPVFAHGIYLGWLFPHPYLHSLVEYGWIPEQVADLDSAARSLLVVTEQDLKAINVAMEPAKDWLEYRLSEVFWQKLDGEKARFPWLANDHEAIRQYGDWARLVLTHDWKAEIIWEYVANSLGKYHKFENVPPMIKPRGGRDGGVDDLRLTRFGLMATQVKGGEVLDNLAENPHYTAYKFFNAGNPNLFRESARKERLALWPLLKEPLSVEDFGGPKKIADRADDALVIHYLVFGRRGWEGSMPRVLGASVPWKGDPTDTGRRADRPLRTLYATSLDMVVLRDPKGTNKLSVDVSSSSDAMVARMEEFGIIEPSVTVGAAS